MQQQQQQQTRWFYVLRQNKFSKEAVAWIVSVESKELEGWVQTHGAKLRGSAMGEEKISWGYSVTPLPGVKLLEPAERNKPQDLESYQQLDHLTLEHAFSFRAKQRQGGRRPMDARMKQ